MRDGARALQYGHGFSTRTGGGAGRHPGRGGSAARRGGAGSPRRSALPAGMRVLPWRGGPRGHRSRPGPLRLRRRVRPRRGARGVRTDAADIAPRARRRRGAAGRGLPGGVDVATGRAGASGAGGRGRSGGARSGSGGSGRGGRDQRIRRTAHAGGAARSERDLAGPQRGVLGYPGAQRAGRRPRGARRGRGRRDTVPALGGGAAARELREPARRGPVAAVLSAGGAARHVSAVSLPHPADAGPRRHHLRVRARGAHHLHRRQPASAAERLLDGRLARSLGRRHPGGRHDPLQRPDLVRRGRQLPQRSVARGRALHAGHAVPPRLRGDDRGPGGLHPPVDDAHAAVSPHGGGASASRLRLRRFHPAGVETPEGGAR